MRKRGRLLLSLAWLISFVADVVAKIHQWAVTAQTWARGMREKPDPNFFYVRNDRFDLWWPHGLVDVYDGATWRSTDVPREGAFTPDGLCGSVFETGQPGRFYTVSYRAIKSIVRGADGIHYEVSCVLKATIFDPDRFVFVNIQHNFCDDLQRCAEEQFAAELSDRVRRNTAPREGDVVLKMHEGCGVRHTVFFFTMTRVTTALKELRQEICDINWSLARYADEAKRGCPHGALAVKMEQKELAEKENRKSQFEQILARWGK